MKKEEVTDETTHKQSGIVERSVMKQLFEEEIGRLDETRSILAGQGHREAAQNVSQQTIGVQTFWEILRNKGIAL